MASVAGLRYLTIGQYVPGDSPIHRLDPRAKLVALALLLAAGLATAKLATNLALFLAISGLVGLARLPFRYIRSSMRPALPVILVLLALQVLFYPSAHRDPAGAGRSPERSRRRIISHSLCPPSRLPISIKAVAK